MENANFKAISYHLNPIKSTKPNPNPKNFHKSDMNPNQKKLKRNKSKEPQPEVNGQSQPPKILIKVDFGQSKPLKLHTYCAKSLNQYQTKLTQLVFL